ncbi:MAG: aminotransferase class I/II-fold pyridoxal phosphate-dependent enzyme, partial [Acidimicrobiia bacterium]|nr:aminotransferase class I/II-fold pyridoxal phosphate-dependent enzyme [Acidimicrobiia bacterium]
QSFFSALEDRARTLDADGIAKAVGAMVSAGELEAGDGLPPIRTVARQLGISSSTVSAAWAIMRRHGIIHTDRRRGTTIRPFASHGRNRYWQVPITGRNLDLDLSTGTPDPELLPPLEPILTKIQTDLRVMSYLDPPVLPELEEELFARWPYRAQALTVLDGANDGLDRVIRSIVRLGDLVVVEDPTYPLVLDHLEQAGAEIIGIGLDDQGLIVEDLAAVLPREPRAVVIQTGAHNPTGIAMTSERANDLASLLAPTDTIVIEDDHVESSDVDADVSLGCSLAHQVYRIQSFSKTYGPDLRVAAVAGPEGGIDKIQQQRQMGPGWTSRLIQRILLEMLRSNEVSVMVDRAAELYALRRQRLSSELDKEGIVVEGDRGLNLWVPVVSEQLATVALAASGIGVSPGQPFRVHTVDPHIRVTSANVRAGFAAVAQAIAAAADNRSAR